MAKNRNTPKPTGQNNKSIPPKKENIEIVETTTAEAKSMVASVPTDTSFWNNKKLHTWLIFFLSCILYVNTLGNQFAIDDSIVIERNMFTQRGMAGIPDILITDTFHGFFKKQKVLVAGGRYRPLTLVMFAIENQLFGTVEKDNTGKTRKDEQGYTLYKYNPLIGHFINILLYGLLGMMIYTFVLKIFNPRNNLDDKASYFIAFVTAVLYIVHPIHTEAVANIKGRDEILSMLLVLLSTHLVLKAYYETAKRTMYIGLSLGVFFLALLAKEGPITFLAVIPLVLYFFAKDENGLRPKTDTIAYLTLPFLVLTLFFWFVIRGSVVGVSISSEQVNELMNNPFLKYENGKYIPFTATERLGTILYSWLLYIKLLIFPHPLTHDYYPKHISIQDISSPLALLSLLLHVGLVVYAVKELPKRNPLSFAILYYFITFSVVSNLVLPIGTNMGERFEFMPSLGFCLAVAVLVEKLGKNAVYTVPTALLGLVLCLGTYKTIMRNKIWYNDYTLFSTDVHTSPNSAKIRNALGGSTLEAAMKLDANNPANFKRMSEIADTALIHLNKAIELHPTYSESYLLMGNAYYYKKDFDKSLASYQKVQEIRPDHQDLSQNMGVVWRDRGRYFGEVKQNVQEAILSLEKARTYLSDDAEIMRLLGIAYGISGNQDKALEYFNMRMKRLPNDPWSYHNLSIAHRLKGDIPKAEEYERKVKELDPNFNPNAGQPTAEQPQLQK